MSFDELTLFISGPTYLSERVRKAALLPEFGHRDKDAVLRLKPAMEHLREIMGISPDYAVLLIPGTGSDAMEASVRSLVRDDERLLCVSVGAFGDLYAAIARSNKPNVEVLRFPDGAAVDLKALGRKLEELRPAAVTVTHNETSTGVMTSVRDVCRLIGEHGALPLVDGVSIMGGAPTFIEEGGVAMYSSSTQKCLALPAGFGIAAVSRAALRKAKDVAGRGYTTDILEHAKCAEKFQTLTTTSTSLANQLFVQTEYIVNQEGVPERFRRHERMRAMTHRWTRSLGDFRLFPKAEDASVSVSCIAVPQTLDRGALKERMRVRGYLFDPGYNKLAVPSMRIGHMGDITEEMLGSYLDALQEELGSLSAASPARALSSQEPSGASS